MAELNSGINLYEELDLAEGADSATIDERLTSLSADAGTDPQTRKFAQLGRSILLSAKKREMYDGVLHDADSDPLTEQDLEQLAAMVIGDASSSSSVADANTTQIIPTAPDSGSQPSPAPGADAFNTDVLGQPTPTQSISDQNSTTQNIPVQSTPSYSTGPGYDPSTAAGFGPNFNPSFSSNFGPNSQSSMQPSTPSAMHAGRFGGNFGSSMQSGRFSVAGRKRTGSLQWFITFVIIFLGVGFGSLAGWSFLDDGLPVFSFPIFIVVTHTILWLVASEMVWQARALFMSPKSDGDSQPQV